MRFRRITLLLLRRICSAFPQKSRLMGVSSRVLLWYISGKLPRLLWYISGKLPRFFFAMRFRCRKCAKKKRDNAPDPHKRGNVLHKASRPFRGKALGLRRKKRGYLFHKVSRRFCGNVPEMYHENRATCRKCAIKNAATHRKCIPRNVATCSIRHHVASVGMRRKCSTKTG